MIAFLAWWKAWGGLVKWAALGLAVAGLLWGAYSWAYDRGHASRDKEVAGLKQDLTDLQARAKAQYDQAVADARAKESQHRAALVLIAETYEKEKRDAELESQRLVAELRAGTVRLRREWTQCTSAAAGRVPGTGQDHDSAGTDGAERQREDLAVAAVRNAAGCDAKVTGLQAIIRQLQGE